MSSCIQAPTSSPNLLSISCQVIFTFESCPLPSLVWLGPTEWNKNHSHLHHSYENTCHYLPILIFLWLYHWRKIEYQLSLTKWYQLCSSLGFSPLALVQNQHPANIQTLLPATHLQLCLPALSMNRISSLPRDFLKVSLISWFWQNTM